ncbi:MAG: hypothetical protein NUV67_04115 [archaeon]|nr:hypothetical protein [archaeon]
MELKEVIIGFVLFAGVILISGWMVSQICCLQPPTAMEIIPSLLEKAFMLPGDLFSAGVTFENGDFLSAASLASRIERPASQICVLAENSMVEKFSSVDPLIYAENNKLNAGAVAYCENYSGRPNAAFTPPKILEGLDFSKCSQPMRCVVAIMPESSLPDKKA